MTGLVGIELSCARILAWRLARLRQVEITPMKVSRRSTMAQSSAASCVYKLCFGVGCLDALNEPAEQPVIVCSRRPRSNAAGYRSDPAMRRLVGLALAKPGETRAEGVGRPYQSGAEADR